MSHQGLQTLTAKDVIFVEGFEQSASLFKNDATLRIKDLLAKIEAICIKSGELSADEIAILFGNGVACEVLRPGAEDWQTGHLNLSLQFQAGSTIITATPAASAPPAAVVAAPAVAEVAAAPVAAVAPPVEVPAVATAPEMAEDALNSFADSTADDAMDFGGFGDGLGESLGDGLGESLGSDLGESLGDGLGDDSLSDGFGDGLGDSLGDAFGEPGASLDDEFNLDADATLGFDEPAAAPASNEFDLDLMMGEEETVPAVDGFDLDGFDLDSTPAPEAALDSLDSPWDLSDDLDGMLMAN
jgi:hypothetical protein